MFSFHSISFPFWENLEAWIMQSRINTSFSRSYVLLISQPALTPSLNAYQLTLLRTWHVKGKWRQKYHFQERSRWQKSGVDLSCSIWRSHFQCKEWVGYSETWCQKSGFFFLHHVANVKNDYDEDVHAIQFFLHIWTMWSKAAKNELPRVHLLLNCPCMLVGEPFLIDVEIEVF